MRDSRRADPFLGSPWFTTVETEPFSPGIEADEKVYFAGSCFAENLHRVWTDHFLPGKLSPFGSTYNPVSLSAAIIRLCRGEKIGPGEVFLHKGLWRHSLFNTLASRPDKEEYLDHINSEIRAHREFLKETSYLVLTLGTAFVYQDMNPRTDIGQKGTIVNNCHQRPSSEFQRRALDLSEITRVLGELKTSLKTLNPDCSVILTLSPVRHLRDGAAENSLSKGLLRCGIDEFLNENPNDDTKSRYFPSYEILLDELRDYRWYASDLCHPSEEAASYITERFFQSAGTPGFQNYLKEARKIKALIDHKVRFPESEEALKFNNKKESALRIFSERYPFALLPQPPG